MSIQGKPIKNGTQVSEVFRNTLFPMYTEGSQEDTVASIGAIIECLLKDESFLDIIDTLRTVIFNNASSVTKLQELLKNFDPSSTYASQLSSRISSLESGMSGKQDKLLNGTNIKSVNGQSLVGAGEVLITPSSISAPTKDEMASAIAAAITSALSQVASSYVAKSTMSEYATKQALASIQTTANQIGLLVKNGVVDASVILNAITDDNGNISSSVKVNADQIEIGSLKSGIKVGGLAIEGTELKSVSNEEDATESIIIDGEVVETVELKKTVTTSLGGYGFRTYVTYTKDGKSYRTDTMELTNDNIFFMHGDEFFAQYDSQGINIYTNYNNPGNHIFRVNKDSVSAFNGKMSVTEQSINIGFCKYDNIDKNFSWTLPQDDDNDYASFDLRRGYLSWSGTNSKVYISPYSVNIKVTGEDGKEVTHSLASKADQTELEELKKQFESFKAQYSALVGSSTSSNGEAS